MPKGRNNTLRKDLVLSHHDLVFLSNLITTLSRHPYRDFFVNHFKHFFEQIIGKEKVDDYIKYNKNKRTNQSFDVVANDIVKFAIKYYPDVSANIITTFYKSKNWFVMNEELNYINGSLLLDPEYMDELSSKSQPIQSFIGHNLYKRSCIHIFTAPPAGGKTLFLLQEAVFQALKNKNTVFYFTIGDMDESSISKRIQKIFEYYRQFGDYQESDLDLIRFYIRPAGSIGAIDIASEIKSFEEKGNNLDMVFIDYDDNLSDFMGNDSMYISASQPYEILDEYKRGKAIVFASQSKINALKNVKEFSSQGVLSSSSRKEQIADEVYAIIYNPDIGITNVKELVVLKDRHGMHSDKTDKVVTRLLIENGVITVYHHDMQSNNGKSKNKKFVKS
ncbi:MAG: hypothetical protein QXN68_03545 [Thermoplasmata archaeon]